MRPLKNQRHEKFAQNIAKGMAASPAYSKAGYEALMSRIGAIASDAPAG